MRKVLLVSNMYPSLNNPSFGVFVRNCENSLKENGFEVNKVVIDRKSNSTLDKVKIYFKFYMQIIKACLQGNYDSLYVHYVSHVALPFILLRIAGNKFDIVSHVHGGDVKQLDGCSGVFFKIKRYLSTFMINNSRVVVSPSKSYARFIHENYKTDLSKFVIYPSGGINDKVFNLDCNETRRSVIGYAGRLVKSKNVDVLLKAMTLNNLTLEIVGDGEEIIYLRAMVKNLELENRVKFLGPMNQKDLADWYSTISALVYPSSSESLGLVPIEAIACGVYPILSDIPSFNELIELGVKGSILKSINSEYINEAINDYIHNDHKKEIEIKNSSIIINKYKSSNFSGTLANVFN